jgi:hypothetical protein
MSQIQFGDTPPPALPVERPLTPGSWRAKARHVITRVMEAARAAQLDVAATIKEIDAAYPFGPREYHPYQMWLKERRRAIAQLGEPVRPAAPVHALNRPFVRIDGLPTPPPAGQVAAQQPGLDAEDAWVQLQRALLAKAERDGDQERTNHFRRVLAPFDEVTA